MAKSPITKDQAVNSLDLLRIVISETIELNSADYACCPFHSEAIASFHIFKASSGRARYHCFGCGAAGDVFNFLAQTKKLSFSAAIEFLSGLIDRPIHRELPSTNNNVPSLRPECVAFGFGSRPLQELLDTTNDDPPIGFCEKDCPKYAALRDDYNAILEQSYTVAGVEINPDLQIVPALVNEIDWLKDRIKALEAELREARKVECGKHLSAGM